jgi:hypothetical protein
MYVHILIFISMVGGMLHICHVQLYPRRSGRVLTPPPSFFVEVGKWHTNGALRCRIDYRKRQKNVKKNSIGLIC